jgi:hypothetical protein
MVLGGESVQAGGERAFGVVHRDDHGHEHVRFPWRSLLQRALT